MTDKEKHIDSVKTNLSLCQEIVNRAERVNKGMRVHDINKLMAEIKPRLKILKERSPEKVSKEELFVMCSYRMALSDNLYLASQHL